MREKRREGFQRAPRLSEGHKRGPRRLHESPKNAPIGYPKKKTPVSENCFFSKGSKRTPKMFSVTLLGAVM